MGKARIYAHFESHSFVEMRDNLVVGIWRLRLDGGVDEDGDDDNGGEPEDQRGQDPCYPNPLNALSDVMV